MILETAEFTVTDGPAFEAAVREARPLFLGSPGCRGLSLHRVVEEPSRYRLLVRWERLEDHTETFRGSEAFTRWRGLVSPFFAAPPAVTHSEEVVS
jgi:heme-degrading monooxygenase HmoA